MTPLCKIEVILRRVWGLGRCAVAVLSMSKPEFSRREVSWRVQSGRLRVRDACVLIGLQWLWHRSDACLSPELADPRLEVRVRTTVPSFQ